MSYEPEYQNVNRFRRFQEMSNRDKNKEPALIPTLVTIQYLLEHGNTEVAYRFVCAALERALKAPTVNVERSESDAKRDGR
jgi:hypothetical protein